MMLLGLLPHLLLLEIGIMYFSAVIQASIGLGFAMLSASILPFFLPMVESTVLISMAVTVLGIYLTWRVRASIDYRAALPAVIGLLMGKALGIVILMNFQGEWLKRGLGAVLLAFAIFFAIRPSKKKLRIRPTVGKGLMLGILAGILGGLYNLAGPFLVIYFFSACSDKYTYTASMNFAFAPASLLGTIMHCFYGNISGPVFYLSLFNTVAVVLGIATGLYIFKRMDRDLIEKFLYALMAVMGTVLAIGG